MTVELEFEEDDAAARAIPAMVADWAAFPQVITNYRFELLVTLRANGVELFRYPLPLAGAALGLEQALGAVERVGAGTYRMGGPRAELRLRLRDGAVELQHLSMREGPLGSASTDPDALRDGVRRFSARVRAYVLRLEPGLTAHPQLGAWFLGGAAVPEDDWPSPEDTR